MNLRPTVTYAYQVANSNGSRLLGYPRLGLRASRLLLVAVEKKKNNFIADNPVSNRTMTNYGYFRQSL